MPRTKADNKKNINHNTNNYPTLAVKLAKCRKAMGLKQVDVSELTGIKRVTLAAYEK